MCSIGATVSKYEKIESFPCKIARIEPCLCLKSGYIPYSEAVKGEKSESD